MKGSSMPSSTIPSAAQPTRSDEIMTTAQAAVATLIVNGIDKVYGLPGLHNDHLFDAIYEAREDLQLIHTRHEQTAGYMAMGAALSTGKPQACTMVPGPGLLNCAGALLTAEGMCAPVLALVGQIPQRDIDRNYGHLHEVRDQLGMARHFTKYAERIKAPLRAPAVIQAAFAEMLSERPGPAMVECAMDVWPHTGLVSRVHTAAVRRSYPIDHDAVRRAAKLLVTARNPMIIVGAGALDAGGEVQAVAERVHAPVLSYRRGRGVITTEHPLAINLPIGHRLWPKVDVVLAIGTRLFIQQQQWGVDADLKVVRIDADIEAGERFLKPSVNLVGDASVYLRALLAELPERSRSRDEINDELRRQRDWFADQLRLLEPQASFLRALRRALPEDGIFVDEVTQVGFVSRLAFPVYKPRTYLSPGYQDTLGWGYGTALGAKAANPGTPVISIAGDGGFLYQLGELATAVHHNLAVVAVVFDNMAFGNVKLIQQQRFGERIIAADLSNPNFLRLAEAFGICARRAETASELEHAVKWALAQNAPALIHVLCGPMPSPWPMLLMPRVRGLLNGAGDEK
jgi:acetolactate synthase-1/2/3 large subunit